MCVCVGGGGGEGLVILKVSDWYHNSGSQEVSLEEEIDQSRSQGSKRRCGTRHIIPTSFSASECA